MGGRACPQAGNDPYRQARRVAVRKTVAWETMGNHLTQGVEFLIFVFNPRSRRRNTQDFLS